MTYLLRPLMRFWLMAAIVVLLPCVALAGGKATMVTTSQPVQQPGRSATAGTPTTMTITWRDADTLRMDMGNEGDYFIMRDGKAYSVSQSDGETMVMDMEGMGAMVQAMANKGKKKENPFGSIDSVKATGATDTVAGVKGRVYHMTWTDPDGSHKSGDAVLTDDPLVVEMTRAYLGSMSTMVGAENTESFEKSLPDDDHGMLRMGDQFRIDSISRSDPPASTFTLPAEPMDLQSLMGGMGQKQ